MDWTAEASLLSVRPHGENGAIIEVLAKEQGRFVGFVRGGTGRTMRPVLQVGNRVKANWRARLSEHLGTFTIEPLKARAALAMHDPLHLSALMTACALVRILPERHPYPKLTDIFEEVLDELGNSAIWPIFVRFELALLEEMGFGLDLSNCAVNGTADDLTHISPRSGRAVSARAAEPYIKKLYPLPPFFLNPTAQATPAHIHNGFAVTGHFLQDRLFAHLERELPEARARMLNLLERDLPLAESESAINSAPK